MPQSLKTFPGFAFGMFIAGIVFACAILFSGCSTGLEKQRAGKAHSTKKERRRSRNSLLFKPLLYIIKKHREVGTHMDGPRCPMYPSCAAYAERALREHSFLGLLMFIDRLFYRETGKLHHKYMRTPKRLSRHLRFYDPLSDSLPLSDQSRPSLLLEDFSD